MRELDKGALEAALEEYAMWDEGSSSGRGRPTEWHIVRGSQKAYTRLEAAFADRSERDRLLPRFKLDAAIRAYLDALPAQAEPIAPHGAAVTDPKLPELLRQSVERVKAMTPAELEEMHRLQRESWVRGEMAMDSDLMEIQKMSVASPAHAEPGAVKETIAKIMQYIEDTIVEASVDYPAGREAGPRIEYDSDAIERFIRSALIASPAPVDAGGEPWGYLCHGKGSMWEERDKIVRDPETIEQYRNHPSGAWTLRPLYLGAPEAALASRPSEGGWRSMESAPKDATIIAYQEATEENSTRFGTPGVVVPMYIDENGTLCHSGTWEPDSGITSGMWCVQRWQPLPTPPSSGEGR